MSESNKKRILNSVNDAIDINIVKISIIVVTVEPKMIQVLIWSLMWIGLQSKTFLD